MRIEKNNVIKKEIDLCVNMISIIYPLTTFPQIYIIYIDKNVDGISLLTWSLYLLCTFPLLLYSIYHKDKRMTVLFGMWTLVYLVVILGVMLHK